MSSIGYYFYLILKGIGWFFENIGVFLLIFAVAVFPFSFSVGYMYKECGLVPAIWTGVILFGTLGSVIGGSCLHEWYKSHQAEFAAEQYRRRNKQHRRQENRRRNHTRNEVVSNLRSEVIDAS
jgi:hypothetical protein